MLSQLVLNGLIAGSVYALVAVGFVLIYSTAQFFHFAHGIVFTAGAYSAYVFAHVVRLPLGVAIVAATLVCGILGASLDLCIYRPLRRRSASALVLLIASLGIYTVLQNVISLGFGDDAKRVTRDQALEGIAILGGRITVLQSTTVAVGVLLVAVLVLVLKFSRAGIIVRAVADDGELAIVRGIDTARVVTCNFAVGSLLAGIGGVLAALDVGMIPTMGMRVFVMAIVASIIGGVNSPLGAACGALLLGLAQHVGVWKLGTSWQDAIAFVILAGFLVARPQGLWGKPFRKVAV